MDGVELYPLKQIKVPKGDLFHALKSTDSGFCGFGEAYFSKIESGQVKGWKRHNKLTLNIIVPYGKIKFVIYDDRKDSISYGKFQEFTLSPEENYCRLTISPGLWMAFEGLSEEDSILLDIINEPHDPCESDKLELYEINYAF